MIDLPKAIFDKLSMPWVNAVRDALAEHDSRLTVTEQQANGANAATSNLRAWIGNLISGAQAMTSVNVSKNIVNLTGRTTSVSAGVAAVFGADGTLGIASSAERFKRDVAPKVYSLDEIAKIQIITYRLISDVAERGNLAPVQAGVIAEQMIAAGFPEFVLYDKEQPLTVDYARMVTVALSGVQQVYSAHQELEERVKALEQG